MPHLKYKEVSLIIIDCSRHNLTELGLKETQVVLSGPQLVLLKGSAQILAQDPGPGNSVQEAMDGLLVSMSNNQILLKMDGEDR